MQFPEYRARRLRKNENFRRLMRETSLSVDDLVYPFLRCPARALKSRLLPCPANSSCRWIISPRSAKSSRAGIPAVCSSAFRRKKMRWHGSFCQRRHCQQAVHSIKMKCPTFWLLPMSACVIHQPRALRHLEKDCIQNDATLESAGRTAIYRRAPEQICGAVGDDGWTGSGDPRGS